MLHVFTSSRPLLPVGLWALAGLVFAVTPVLGQSLDIDPSSPTLQVGESQQLRAFYVGPDGERRRDTTVVFLSRNGNAAPATRGGEVTANEPGTHEIIALRPGTANRDRIVQRVSITVRQAAVGEVAFAEAPAQMYAGTTVPLTVEAQATNGRVRDDVTVEVESEAPGVATVDRLRRVHGAGPGTVTLTAQAEGHEGTTTVEVVENPVASLDLSGGADSARTGDVLDFAATARTEAGTAVGDAPIRYAVRTGQTEDIAPGAAAEIGPNGRFVAEDAGQYTVVATSGTHTARHTVTVAPRDLPGSIEVVDHARVSNVHTSDLWVWEAPDGRDYALTGTWGGDGEAYFWDVTDPSDITPVDTVTVDARTVNDVKVSEDGRTCIISREGASDRKNGMVLLDCSDPTDVSIVTEYTNRLTGGVHNLFIYEDHVYALSNGRRYEIINIEDRAHPRRVTDFELETPGHSIHDVWVEDGIAYSSNWDDGIVMVDVGNGVKGGSPSNPVEIGRYAYPSGWNHAAFPYDDPETGKDWVVAGDEAFPNGLNTENEPTIPDGWLHFVDVSDPQAPSEEARYRVPEAGSHNYWVDGDTLYVAYYNAGLRVVDLSGDLKGNLYEQGREIAHFKPHDLEGRIPNAAMTWGPQPHKGHIFFSDWNSGLWAVELTRDE
ncbi:Ig-like domain-containing protein [Salinibacter altiplanensis]|uniref:Ig-like domain-containing protein n=1 Tax=Salinibacter altiplanensis TaxID=1803181 RepID=UPI000C9FDD45|nr:Ig-like domain-containing protein [Salinibacter altiplanensis]